MVFWQLTIDANDPALLARFWAKALGYRSVPPVEPATTWHAHYQARLGDEPAFDDRLFDPVARATRSIHPSGHAHRLGLISWTGV